MLTNKLHTSESLRGVWASFMVSLLFVWVEVMLEQGRVKPDAIFLYNDLLVGSTVGFLADKFFATTTGYSFLRAGNLSGNAAQALAAVSSTEFLRYFVTVFIDALVSVPLFVKSLKSFPKMGAVQRRMVKYAISLITFATFNNPLRFGWAYASKATPQMDLIVAAFLVCASMSYLNAPAVNPGTPGYAVMNRKARMLFVAAGWLCFALYQLVRSGIKMPKVPSSVILALILAVSGWAMFSSRGDQDPPGLSSHLIGVGAVVIMLANTVWFVRTRSQSATQKM